MQPRRSIKNIQSLLEVHAAGPTDMPNATHRGCARAEHAEPRQRASWQPSSLAVRRVIVGPTDAIDLAGVLQERSASPPSADRDVLGHATQSGIFQRRAEEGSAIGSFGGVPPDLPWFAHIHR